MKKKMVLLLVVILMLVSFTFAIDGCGPWEFAFDRYGCIKRNCNGSEWTTIVKQRWLRTCFINGEEKVKGKWTEHHVHCGC